MLSAITKLNIFSDLAHFEALPLRPQRLPAFSERNDSASAFDSRRVTGESARKLYPPSEELHALASDIQSSISRINKEDARLQTRQAALRTETHQFDQERRALQAQHQNFQAFATIANPKALAYRTQFARLTENVGRLEQKKIDLEVSKLELALEQQNLAKASSAFQAPVRQQINALHARNAQLEAKVQKAPILANIWQPLIQQNAARAQALTEIEASVRNAASPGM